MPLANLVNFATRSGSSIARSHIRQRAFHTSSHNKYETFHSRSHNMDETFYSRSHSKNRVSYRIGYNSYLK